MGTLIKAYTDLQNIYDISDDAWFVVDSSADLYIETSQVSSTEHYLYIVNYSGLRGDTQDPMVQDLQTVTIKYHLPSTVSDFDSITVFSPDIHNSVTKGAVTQGSPDTIDGQSVHPITFTMDQFSLIKLELQ